MDSPGKQNPRSGNLADSLPKFEYDLAGQIIGLAMKVHRTLEPGFLESVYQKALLYESAKAGLKVASDHYFRSDMRAWL